MAVILFSARLYIYSHHSKRFLFQREWFFFDELFVHFRAELFCFNKSDFFFCIIAKFFCFMKEWFYFLQDLSIYNISELVCCHDRFIIFLQACISIHYIQKHFFTYGSDFFLQTWHIIAELFLFPWLLFYFLKDYTFVYQLTP